MGKSVEDFENVSAGSKASVIVIGRNICTAVREKCTFVEWLSGNGGEYIK